MSGIAVRMTVIMVAAVGFVALLLSIAFDSPAAQWIAPVGYVLIGIGLLIALVRSVRRTRKPRGSSSELSASDEYADLQLGRRPITHYPRDDAGTSQFGDPPQRRPPTPGAGDGP